VIAEEVPANVPSARKVEKIKQGKLTFYYGIEQGTQEWLDLRADRATCSNALKVCERGLKFAIEINRQHAARKTPNGNQYAERGHVLEDEVKERIQESFDTDNLELVSCSFITHDDYPHAGYSPDWLVLDRNTHEFVCPIEIKCFMDKTERYNTRTGEKSFVTKDKHKLCCESIKNMPLEYIMQFEMEMLMTETDQLLVILYNPDAEGGVPQFKMHVYHPEQITKDDKPYYIYQERLKEVLSKKLN